MMWSNILLFTMYVVIVSIAAPAMVWPGVAFVALVLTIPGAIVVELVQRGKL